MPFYCPHCSRVANRRSSRVLTEQSKETRYSCTCGHSFRCIEQIVQTLSPSAQPNQSVHLNMTNNHSDKENRDGF